MGTIFHSHACIITHLQLVKIHVLLKYLHILYTDSSNEFIYITSGGTAPADPAIAGPIFNLLPANMTSLKNNPS